jgi:predicted secreted protein
MNPATITLTFVMLWWLIFFMLLPIGVQRDKNPQPGNAVGAPKNGRLLKKAIFATLVAMIITISFFFFLQHGYLDFLSPRE